VKSKEESKGKEGREWKCHLEGETLHKARVKGVFMTLDYILSERNV
jgi:hypothetical protein